MALTLYIHPLASFCHKVLIALYENGTEFHPVTVDSQRTPAPLALCWNNGLSANSRIA